MPHFFFLFLIEKNIDLKIKYVDRLSPYLLGPNYYDIGGVGELRPDH